MTDRKFMLMTAIFFSVSMAFLETLLDMLIDAPKAFENLLIILPSLVFSSLGLFFFFFIFWLLIAFPLIYYYKLNHSATTISISVFLTLNYVLFLLIESNLGDRDFFLTDWFKLLLTAIISSVIAFGSYFSFQYGENSKTYKQVCKYFGSSAPFLFAELMLLIWIFKYKINITTSNWTLPILVCFFIIFLFTLWIFYRIINKQWAFKFLNTTLLIFIISPFISFAFLISQNATVKEFETKAQQIEHIILISVDTLRPDVLTCYNENGVSTPNIDQIANDGMLFKNAISPSSWTLPAISSILTGLPPSVHQAINRDSKLSHKLKTLAEYLKEANYYTGAIGANQFLVEERNVNQGFIDYNFFPKSSIGNTLGSYITKKLFPQQFEEKVTTGELTDLAVKWVKQASQNNRNIFLWLHYLDPHVPYNPPAKYLPDLEPPPSIGTKFGATTSIRSGKFIPTIFERKWIQLLYEKEVRYVDDNIGRFITALKQFNIYDESLIVVLSDHGEEFWEHGGFEHGHTLYNEVIRVPLIIKLPESFSNYTPKPVQIRVSTQNIFPTILELCDIDFDQNMNYTTSLTPLWSNNQDSYRPIPVISSGLLYFDEQESVIFGDTKYIRSLLNDAEELYHLADDPEEQFSYAKKDADQIELALNMLEEYHKSSKKVRNLLGVSKSEHINLDKETLRKLRSMGYIR